EAFGRYEGKFVIQLFNDDELLDERVYTIAPGTPRLVSNIDSTIPAQKASDGMVKIPQGSFKFHSTHGDDFIAYPSFNEDSVYQMPSFYMDKFPVTNKQFKDFLDATNYSPADTTNFLKNWVN